MSKTAAAAAISTKCSFTNGAAELLFFRVYTQRDLFADVSKERRAVVITIGNYVKPKSLEEAYELNQARSSRVMGGMMWMRLGTEELIRKGKMPKG